VFALSESGSIRSNYSCLEHVFGKGVLEKISLNSEMLLQEAYEYKPLVNYLKKKLKIPTHKNIASVYNNSRVDKTQLI